LDTFQVINPEYRLDTLRKLQKLIPTAQALVEQTDDKDLRAIVASIAAHVART
jgi:phenylalanine-4-hydroxylase